MLARVGVAVIVAGALACLVEVPRPAAAQARHVVINEVAVPDSQLRMLERGSRVRIPDGSYWYDRVSGAWGFRGGPTMGFTVAGLPVGGPLRADASNGTTGVFINGRQLHIQDALALQALLGAVYPGRYWVDAQGNAGFEGGPPLVNLVVVARARAAQGAGGGAYSVYDRLGGMFGSDGNGCLVYADRDVSYSSSGC
jgi:hypothetical protein